MLGRRSFAVALAVLFLGQLASAADSFNSTAKIAAVKKWLDAPGFNSSCKSIYGFIKGNPDFTFLQTAIEVSGLISLFDDPALTGTFMAPTDQAWTATIADLALDPQTTLNKHGFIAELLLYQIFPGYAVTKAELAPDQLYPTLLIDSTGVVGQWQYKFADVVDLVALADGGNLTDGTTLYGRYRIYPSGGTYAKITKFDQNIGCPSILHYINYVLLPSYLDQTWVDLNDVGIATASTFDDANVTARYRQQYPALYAQSKSQATVPATP